MKLGFYELLNIALCLTIAGIITSSFILKMLYDQNRAWRVREKQILLAEIDRTGFDPERLRAGFHAAHRRIFRKERYYRLLEDTLFELIEQNEQQAALARAIAAEFDLPARCIANLTKHRRADVVLGCMQAKAYRYRPAVPYLLSHLKNPVFCQQYDILRALSRYDDPDLIIQAFEIIKDHMFVNENTIYEILHYLTPDNKIILFKRILSLHSEMLSSQFLKFIDKHTALALQEQIVPLYCGSASKELRIAAVKAMAAGQDITYIKHLETAFRDSEWEVRVQAVKGLAEHAGEAGEALLPLLTEAICDANWWVRQNAAIAILNIPSPEAGIVQVLRSGDRYAIDSLIYAAEKRNLLVLLNEHKLVDLPRITNTPAESKAPYKETAAALAGAV